MPFHERGLLFLLNPTSDDIKPHSIISSCDLGQKKKKKEKKIIREKNL